MSRKEDLEQNIRESYDLIRQHEALIQTSSDPKEQVRSRRAIEEQWGFIKGYLEEYLSLCEQLQVSIPDDLVEIAASPPATPKYVIHIERAEGLAIGDRAQATQRFDGESLPPAWDEYPYQAPRPLPEFVGREEEIQRLKDTLRPGSRVAIVGVVGMGGIGKTELVKLVAHQVADRYKDGVLWADCGQQELLTIADLWAAEYGRQLAGRNLPTKAAAWRGLISNKEALLVFDDLQIGQEVEPLFPPARSRSSILITTRHAHHPALHGINPLRLDQFTSAEAMALAKRVLGQETAHDQQAEANTLFEMVGYLPLAISIALHMAREQGWTLAELNQELKQAGAIRVLKEPDRDRTLRSTCQTAWDNLPNDLQQAFQASAVFNQGASFNIRAMAAVLETTELQARALLNRLAGRSLLTRVGDDRWSLHPLLREFAQECLEKMGQEEKARAHHAKFFLDLAHDLGDQIQATGFGMALDRLDQDLPDVRAALEWTVVELRAGRLDYSWLDKFKDAALAKGLALEFRSRFEEAANTFRQLWDTLGATLELTEEQTRFLDELPTPTPEPDPSITQRVRSALQFASPYYRDLAFTCLHIGVNEWRMGQKDKAWLWCKRGYWIAVAGDVGLELARANNLLGILHRADSNLDRAIQHGERGLDILREQAIEDPSTKAAILNSLGIAYRQERDFIKAIECSRKAKALEKQLGNIINQANCSTGLAEALRAVGQYELAIAEGEEALAIYRRVGHTEGEIASLMDMSESYVDQEEGEKALEIAQEMTRIFEEHDQRQDIFRMGAAVYTILGRAYFEVGQFEQALSAAKRARGIAEQPGLKPFLPDALHLMAKVLRALGRESEARDCEALANGLSE